MAFGQLKAQVISACILSASGINRFPPAFMASTFGALIILSPSKNQKR